LRQKATERPFTGRIVHNKAEGVYTLRPVDRNCCDSLTKFESGTGWPSFWDVIEKGNVELITDNSHGCTASKSCAVDVASSGTRLRGWAA
jgi:peptide-methionine (R)-S-oxide reductase